MFSKLSLLAATASAAGWNYADDNGADWPSVDTSPVTNECGMTNQSPIDLKSYNSEKKDDFPYKTYKSSEDMYRKTYSNQVDSKFYFNGHTTQLDLDAADGVNAFTSRMGEKLFGTVQDFSGVQFHFHAGSEHTVDGKRHDFEMHTVHITADTATAVGAGENIWQSFKGQPGDIGAAAVGIIFSVEDYTADLTWAEQEIIDTFFDSLVMSDLGTDEAGDGKLTHDIDMALYGNLMQLVDNNNRWVYKGSVTTPPCARFVYWNVMSTIYPISRRHLDLFKAQLNQGEAGELDERGNYRRICKEDEHNVAYIMTGGGDDGRPMYKGLVAGVIVLAVISALLLGITGWLCLRKPAKKEGAEIEMETEKKMNDE